MCEEKGTVKPLNDSTYFGGIRKKHWRVEPQKSTTHDDGNSGKKE